MCCPYRDSDWVSSIRLTSASYRRAISRDENLYPSPEEFIPERFAGEKPALDPYHTSFGYGRRCVTLSNSWPIPRLLTLSVWPIEYVLVCAVCPCIPFSRQIYCRCSIGMHFADAVIWMTITSLLATIHFSKAKDASGNEITPVPKYFEGGVVRWAHISHNDWWNAIWSDIRIWWFQRNYQVPVCFPRPIGWHCCHGTCCCCSVISLPFLSLLCLFSSVTGSRHYFCA